MRCSNCGKPNDILAKTCSECGYSFDKPDNEVEFEDATISFKPIVVEKANDKKPSINASAIESPIPQISVADELGDEEIAPISEKKRKANKAITIIVWAFLLVFFISAAVFGINFVMKLVNPSSNGLLISTVTAPPIQTPKILVQTDENGEQYIYAEFYGTVGDSIYLSVTNRYYEFTDTVLKLSLYKKDIFTDSRTFDSSTAIVYLSPSYVTGSKKYEIQVSPVTLDIPAAKLQLLSPTADSTEVFQDSYIIKLIVAPESTVVINGVTLTDKVDKLGQLNYTVNISPDTSNSFEIKVNAPFSTPAAHTVVITRAAMPVVLTLDKSNLAKVSVPQITITGITEKDVTLTSNLTVLSLEQNALNNTFSMTLKLDAYGNYPIKIMAQNSVKGISTLIYNVLYWPDEDTYTRKARVYESKLSTNPSAYKGIIFLFNAVTVQEVVSNDPTTFIVNMGTTDKPELLLFEYIGSKTIKAGDKIKIFADVEGASSDGTAKLNARFIY